MRKRSFGGGWPAALAVGLIAIGCSTAGDDGADAEDADSFVTGGKAGSSGGKGNAATGGKAGSSGGQGNTATGGKTGSSGGNTATGGKTGSSGGNEATGGEAGQGTRAKISLTLRKVSAQ